MIILQLNADCKAALQYYNCIARVLVLWNNAIKGLIRLDPRSSQSATSNFRNRLELLNFCLCVSLFGSDERIRSGSHWCCCCWNKCYTCVNQANHNRCCCESLLDELFSFSPTAATTAQLFTKSLVIFARSTPKFLWISFFHSFLPLPLNPHPDRGSGGGGGGSLSHGLLWIYEMLFPAAVSHRLNSPNVFRHLRPSVAFRIKAVYWQNRHHPKRQGIGQSCSILVIILII